MRLISSRLLSVIVLLTFNQRAILPPIDPEGSNLSPLADINPCTYEIPPEDTIVDGQDNYAQVKPGDVLCLPAGTRPNIKFQNLNGSKQKPIMIRNSGGRVTISGTENLSGGIGIANSSFLHLSGSATSNQCGASFLVREQDCGIEITDAYKGVKIDTDVGEVHDIEIDHLTIHDILAMPGDIETRGINLHPRLGQTVSGVHIHHNFISNIPAEGIYIGSEPDDTVPFEQLGKMENVEVSYNRVQNTGYDGINVKVAILNVNVHHNVVDDTGVAPNPAQQGGIKMMMSAGTYFNNLVIAEYVGIRMGKPLPNAQPKFFNNVVLSANTIGIEVLDESAMVYNNTVVNSGQVGISAPGALSKVFDNIVVGTSGTAIQGIPENISNNLTGPIAIAGFIDHQARDYRLRATSPAINAGRDAGTYPKFDFMGMNRPQGGKTDLGAFEYSRLSVLSDPRPSMCGTTLASVGVLHR